MLWKESVMLLTPLVAQGSASVIGYMTTLGRGVFVELLIPVLIIIGIMLCFCTIAITCAKALIHRWVGNVEGGTPEFRQMLKYQYVSISHHDDAPQLEDCNLVGGGFFADVLDWSVNPLFNCPNVHSHT